MKKFLRYIFTIALFAGMCFCGYKYITDWGKPDPNYLPELEASIETNENNLLGIYNFEPDFGDGFIYLNNTIYSILNDAAKQNVQTVIIRGDTFNEKCNVYKSTDDNANHLLEFATENANWNGNEWTAPYYYSVEESRANAIELVEGLSKKTSTSEGLFYNAVCSETWQSKAFGNLLYQGTADAYPGNIAEYLKNDGLELELSNTEVKTILIIEPALLTDNTGRMYALLESDIKCNNNIGKYSKLSWIPEIGTSKRSKIFISFSSICQPRGELHKRLISLGDIMITN